MNWKYFTPTFEYDQELKCSDSAWTDHRYFAYDLVRNIKPGVVVELGTHKGTSFFSFCQAVKDGKINSKLIAVDTWGGDKHSRFYSEEVFKLVQTIQSKYYSKQQIELLKITFDQALSRVKENSIDLLHIDGLHTYEAVKHDFDSWLHKVKKNGIILLHDTIEKTEDFGVYKLWEEIEKQYTTILFTFGHGLGVVLLNENEKDVPRINQDVWNRYYVSVAQLDLKEKEIANIKGGAKDFGRIKEDNQKLNNELLKLQANYRKLDSSYNAILQDYKEFQGFKAGKIWKSLAFYRKLKRAGRIGTKRIIKNIRNEGLLKTIIKCCSLCTKWRYYIHESLSFNEINLQYQKLLSEQKISEDELDRYRSEQKKFPYRPLVSIILPVYNTQENFLHVAIDSIISQVYTNWELCISDDASPNPKIKEVLKEYKDKDTRIKLVFRSKRGHISTNSNSALKIAKGEFIAIFDHDDVMDQLALYKVMKFLNQTPRADFIYTDEDKLDQNNQRVDPFFKPDWSPDMFLSVNYICHLSVIRKKSIDSIGGFRTRHEGAQDYDLFLRITEKTKNIYHIPEILYSWRKTENSTSSSLNNKSYAQQASINALNDAIKRRNLQASVTEGIAPGNFRVKYKIKNNPLISIIIPTKDKVHYLKTCIDSIINKTSYKKYEIILVNNSSIEKGTYTFFNKLGKYPFVKIIPYPHEYNFASINNYAVNKAKGEYVVLLNNDTEIIEGNWLTAMLEHAQRKETGAVGAKLLYPNGTIQHAGVVVDYNRLAEHVLLFFPDHIKTGAHYPKDIIRNYSAVTAACLMISKGKYIEVGGLDERYRIAYNDIDFCLKLKEKGYFNVYTPYAKLYHHESISVGRPGSNIRDNKEFQLEMNFLKERLKKDMQRDPYFYNIHLFPTSDGFKLKFKD